MLKICSKGFPFLSKNYGLFWESIKSTHLHKSHKLIYFIYNESSISFDLFTKKRESTTFFFNVKGSFDFCIFYRIVIYFPNVHFEMFDQANIVKEILSRKKEYLKKGGSICPHKCLCERYVSNSFQIYFIIYLYVKHWTTLAVQI